MFPKMLNKKLLINTLCEELGYEGYKASVMRDVYIIEKKYKNGIKEAFTFNEYDDWDKRGMMPSVTIRKSFPEVDKILKRHYKNNNLSTILLYTLEKYFFNPGHKDIYFPDMESIKEGAKYFDKVIKENGFPFFERYRTIEDIYKDTIKIEDDYDKLHKLFNYPADIKHLVIKRLVGDPGWEDYGEMLLSKYEVYSRSGTLGVYTPALKSIIEELKSM